MSDKLIKIGVNCFVFKDGKVLLGKRLAAAGAGTWGLPGGHLEEGEHLENAAKRELMEETGLKVEALEFLQLVNNPRLESHYLQINFHVTKWSGELQLMEPEKCEKWEWFDLENLPEPIFFGHEKFFPAFKNNVHFIS